MKDISSLPTEPIVTVRDLSKTFKLKSGEVEVLSDINFDIHLNSFAIIFGPSGSGKSTLLNIISGLESPTSGTVTVDRRNLYTLSNDDRARFRANTMGIVHQENYWVNSLSVLENVALPLYLTGSPRVSAMEVARDSLEKIGMVKYIDYAPSLLSGGQQQRVSLARALVASPQLILADEPTGNLDSKNGQEVIDILLYFQQKLDRTIVLVTHNIDYLSLSDMQLYVRDGRVTESHRGQKMPEEIIKSLKTQLVTLTEMEKNS